MLRALLRAAINRALDLIVPPTAVAVGQPAPAHTQPGRWQHRPHPMGDTPDTACGFADYLRAGR